MNDAPVLPGLRPRIAGVGLNRAERVGLEKPYHVATIDHDKALIVVPDDRLHRSIAGR
jgi:hypothetical protein